MWKEILAFLLIVNAILSSGGSIVDEGETPTAILTATKMSATVTVNSTPTATVEPTATPTANTVVGEGRVGGTTHLGIVDTTPTSTLSPASFQSQSTTVTFPNLMLSALLILLVMMAVLLGAFMMKTSRYLREVVRDLGRVNYLIDRMLKDQHLAKEEWVRVSETRKKVTELARFVLGEGTRPLAMPGLQVELLAAPSVRYCGDPNAPQPLAEDVTGTLTIPPHYFLGYVSDGAPGPTVEGYISSRTHARVLGRNVFLEWAKQALRKGSLCGPGEEERFKREIAQRMEMKLRENLGQGFKNMLRRRLEDLPRYGEHPGLRWQASFTGIVFDVNTRTLHVFQIGDTLAVVGLRSGRIETVSGDPFETRLLWVEGGIRFEFNLSPLIKQFEDVQGVAVMSDGVYGTKRNLSILSSYKRFEEIVQHLRTMPIPSADDKALLIVSLLGG